MRCAVLCLLLLLAAASDCRCGETTMDMPGPVADKRFEIVRHLNLPCDVSYMKTRYLRREDWDARAQRLRRQVLASAGLLPAPERTQLDPRVFGLADNGDYTIQKVYFESWPGFLVAGNLYRPKGKGPFPAVLNPHGHWEHGRLEDSDLCSVPGRCINFAKQGYVAFAYDMIGYNDSRQIDHKFGGQREKLWGISLGGLQLWNSIRAVDFIESLPEVDGNRIACTGASGGGTQAFLLTAVDDRVKVSAPVNMISAHMQGGCNCENLPNLRIDTDNVEIGALMAPRPMIMVSATGDWTKDTPEIEFPAVQSIYKLLDAEDKASCIRVDAGHNYNKDSREAVYSWFGQWLPSKPLPQPVRERSYVFGKPEDLLVFPDGKLPAGTVDAASMSKYLIAASDAQLESHRPKDARGLEEFRKLYEPSLRRALSVPDVIEPQAQGTKLDEDITRFAITDTARGTAVPALLAGPAAAQRAVLVVYEQGMAADRAKMDADVLRLAGAGCRVLAIDCFNTGSHTAPEGSPARDVTKDFFDTYNRTDCAERVYDILLAIRWLKQQPGISGVGMVGSGRAGLWCLLAKPFAQEVDALAVDAAGLDVSSDDAFLGDLYVPCIRRAGDFRTAMALAAPSRLLIHNTQGRFDTRWAKAAYAAADRPEALRVEHSQVADADLSQWVSGR